MPTSRILLWSGLATVAGGAVLCALGWYGISGERYAERQLPYLASCTVPGAALIVAGAVLIGVAALLPAPPPKPAPAEPEETSPPSSEGPPLRVPGGTLAHRPDCPLVAGKAEAVDVGDAELAPCPVCEPWPP
ncbi:hypothetical protein ACFW2Y_31820 [Streptomyces sp. NPDC058877]|uniref:hypothetical protein n=1 Tax=unclassified Streptomyces TaxID=2593676 RepID=UPI003695556A